MTDIDERVRRGLFDGRQLATPRLFPETQALAYALRERYDVPVSRVAEELDVSESRVYNATAEARDRIDAMHALLDLLDSDEWPTPDRCEECGDGLASWTIDADGRALCPDCAGVPTDEINA